MNEKTKLLNKISMYGFSMWELHIYLNTHPNCQSALSMYEDYQRKYNEAVAEYEKKYGPLNTASVNHGNMWQWIENPWPWDYEED